MATLVCSFCGRRPSKVHVMDLVTQQRDPRGIPAGYPDPETSRLCVREDLTPDDTVGKYLSCDSCCEECHWYHVSRAVWIDQMAYINHLTVRPNWKTLMDSPVTPLASLNMGNYDIMQQTPSRRLYTHIIRCEPLSVSLNFGFAFMLAKLERVQ